MRVLLFVHIAPGHIPTVNLTSETASHNYVNYLPPVIFPQKDMFTNMHLNQGMAGGLFLDEYLIWMIPNDGMDW